MKLLQEMWWTTKQDYGGSKKLGYGPYSLLYKHCSWVWLGMLHRIGVIVVQRSEHGSQELVWALT